MTEALKQWKDMDRLRDAAPEMLEMIKEQHKVIDILFAMMIQKDIYFLPSKSGFPWEVITKTNSLINRLEN